VADEVDLVVGGWNFSSYEYMEQIEVVKTFAKALQGASQV
jgi:hypothetical protein